MAVRACVVEGKGDCSAGRLDEYRKLMTNLWNEISAIADDDKVILFNFFTIVSLGNRNNNLRKFLKVFKIKEKYKTIFLTVPNLFVNDHLYS